MTILTVLALRGFQLRANLHERLTIIDPVETLNRIKRNGAKINLRYIGRTSTLTYRSHYYTKFVSRRFIPPLSYTFGHVSFFSEYRRMEKKRPIHVVTMDFTYFYINIKYIL